MYRLVGPPLHNASALFRALHQNDPAALLAKTTLDQWQAADAAIAAAIAGLDHDPPGTAPVATALRLAAGLLSCGVRRARWLQTRDRADARQLLKDLQTWIPAFRTHWLADSRPGGLSESSAPLERRHDEAQTASLARSMH